MKRNRDAETPGQAFVLDMIGRLTGSVIFCGCVRCRASVAVPALYKHDCTNPTLGDVLRDARRKREGLDG